MPPFIFGILEMNWSSKRLSPLIVDGVEYNVGYELYNNEVALPFFEVTTRHGRKLRDKKIDKYSNHFDATHTGNGLKVMNRVTEVLREPLSKYNFIIILVHMDKLKVKRKRVYIHYMKKLGFTEVSKEYGEGVFFMYRQTDVKKKEVRKIFDNIVDYIYS